jgi:FkbM family methyltransferase
MPFKNDLPSFVYNLLIYTSNFRNPRLVDFWQFAWKKSCEIYKGPVRTTIHGKKVIVNFGYTYPIYSRRFPKLNNPLIELVFQAYKAKHKPIIFADIGAAIGDTALLVNSNCPGMIQKLYCVEGDPEFFMYLESNLSHMKYCKCFMALLSSTQGEERALLRTHSGSASAQGDKHIPAVTLDSVLLQPSMDPIDVLKIDLDGLDGKVMVGSSKLIKQHFPAIIFEWHPGLCKITDNNWTDHFEVPFNYGYNRFVWFTKFGDFSHFMMGYNRTDIDSLAELCIRDCFEKDWHYDVIALHENSQISIIDLAELNYIHSRRYKY